MCVFDSSLITLQSIRHRRSSKVQIFVHDIRPDTIVNFKGKDSLGTIKEKPDYDKDRVNTSVKITVVSFHDSNRKRAVLISYKSGEIEIISQV